MGFAITDLRILTTKTEKPPQDWVKIPIDLNEGVSGSDDLFLAYYCSEDQALSNCITEIDIAVPQNIKADWTSVKDSFGKPVNVNKGTKGTELNVIYKKGGLRRPIVGLSISRTTDKDKIPKGYEVIPMDLNDKAGGSDLFIIFMRQTRTLTIGKVRCVTPSSGYDAQTVSNVIASLGAATGAVAGLASAPTGPGAILVAAGAAAATTTVTTLLTNAINDLFSDWGKGTADDVSIRADGFKAFPIGKNQTSYSMKSGDSVDVNLVFPLENDLKISFIESDKLFWFINTDKVSDLLGELYFSAKENQSGVYLFYNTDEGSSYLAEIVIDNTSPLLSVTSNMPVILTLKSENEKDVILYPSKTVFLPTFSGQVWKIMQSGITEPLLTYEANDEPNQVIILPKPNLHVNNYSQFEVHAYNTKLQKDVHTINANEQYDLETLPGTVWVFKGIDHPVLLKYTATKEPEQKFIVEFPSLKIVNKTQNIITVTSPDNNEITLNKFDDEVPYDQIEIEAIFQVFYSSTGKSLIYLTTDSPNQVLNVRDTGLEVE